MKHILFSTLFLMSGLAGSSPAAAQEDWSGVQAPVSFQPFGTATPASLVGNEYIEARCNNEFPVFACPAGVAGQRASLVPISEFARASSVSALSELNRREGQRGIAAALAMGSASMPSAPGRTSYVFNLSTFRGEQALGGSIMHRFASDTPIALSLGFSVARGGNEAGRIGVAGEF
jgi:hypothetical protein